MREAHTYDDFSGILLYIQTCYVKLENEDQLTVIIVPYWVLSSVTRKNSVNRI